MPDRVTPELVAQLARYANLSLSDERSALLARLLATALADLHAIRIENYQQTAPAVVFRVPPRP